MEYLETSYRFPRIIEIIKNNLPNDMYLNFIEDGYLDYKNLFPIWLLGEKPIDTYKLTVWHRYRLHTELLELYHDEIKDIYNRITQLSVDGEVFPDHCLEYYIGTLLCQAMSNESIMIWIDRNLKRYDKYKTLNCIYKHNSCKCNACIEWCYEDDSDKNEQIYWILHRNWDDTSTILDNIKLVVIRLYDDEWIYELKTDGVLILNDLKNIAHDLNKLKEIGMMKSTISSLQTKLEDTVLFINLI
jgi:hypothetical protein